jgi:hypothetical protein
LAPKKTDRRPKDFLFGTEGCGGEGGKSSRALEPRKELRQHIPTGLEGRRYRKVMAEYRLPIAEKLFIVAWATGCRSASTAPG